MAEPRHRARDLPAHRLHAAGARAEPLSRSQRAREHRLLRAAVRPGPRRARGGASPSCWRPPASRRSPTARRGKLSGGMRQKLGLCCALVHDPDLLILDEPTTGVDPLSRRQFWELIERMRARRPGMSVIVATAYMEEAERFDWLVAMDAGARPRDRHAGGAQGAAPARHARGRLHRPAAGRQCAPAIARLASRRAATSSGEPAIAARGLTRRFGDFTAVDHVSFASSAARSSASSARTAAARRRR